MPFSPFRMIPCTNMWRTLTKQGRNYHTTEYRRRHLWHVHISKGNSCIHSVHRTHHSTIDDRNFTINNCHYRAKQRTKLGYTCVLHPRHPANVHLAKVLLRRCFRDEAVHLSMPSARGERKQNTNGTTAIVGPRLGGHKRRWRGGDIFLLFNGEHVIESNNFFHKKIPTLLLQRFPQKHRGNQTWTKRIAAACAHATEYYTCAHFL